jgi:hypothetical protein
MRQNTAGISLHSELATTQLKVYFLCSFIPSACLCLIFLFIFLLYHHSLSFFLSLFIYAISFIHFISSYFLLGIGNENILVNRRTKFRVRRTFFQWKDALPRRDYLCSLSICFLHINVNRQAISKLYSSSEYRPF